MPGGTLVGIVVNPSAGHDIRRLVADGALVTAHHKVNVVRRLLAGLRSVGVDRVLSMTDRGGISSTLSELANGPAGRAWPALEFVDQRLTHSAADTTAAVGAMLRAEVGAIVVLGGDGTNGVVADACGDVPIASISTGTNNAFPRDAEPTVVGLAAGLVATGAVDADEVAHPTKRLNVRCGPRRYRALVDVAVTAHDSVASGAVWDPSMVSELFLCFAEPHRIGLSSIGAHVRSVRRTDPFGLHVRLGRPTATAVRVPLGPGLVRDVELAAVSEIPTGSTVPVRTPRGVVAVDGERVSRFGASNTVAVTLTTDGPRAIDVEATMQHAASRGLLRHPHSGTRDRRE